jgi:L-threonylcarbamoyladenylate synthase
LATDLIVIDTESPESESIERAAAAVLRGKVVAIPTEARYSLVADPFNLRAVSKSIRGEGAGAGAVAAAAGGRSDDGGGVGERGVGAVPDSGAALLAPGPLTIIVPASAKVPLRVTGNTGRLAMRQSQSKVAQALIEKINQPLIATSANLSGQPTCASGIEVFGTMDGRVDLVLDGGLCPGLGATTVDITEPYWRVIKEGSIPEKDLAEILHRT